MLKNGGGQLCGYVVDSEKGSNINTGTFNRDGKFDTTTCTTRNEPGYYSNHLRRKERYLRLRLLMIEFRKSHASMGNTIGNTTEREGKSPPLIVSIHMTLNNTSNLWSQGTM